MIEKERTLQNSFYEANFCSQKKKKPKNKVTKKNQKQDKDTTTMNYRPISLMHTAIKTLNKVFAK